MGKGSRNRQLHYQSRLENPTKYAEKKKAPKWLGSAIAIALAVVILAGVIAGVVIDSGIVKRNRVLFESQTGKYDVNQSMVTFLVWQQQYSEWYYYWLYCKYGMMTDETGLVNSYSSGDSFALVLSKHYTTEYLRDSADAILETVKIYLAVADEAERNGVKLTDADKKEIDTTVASLKTMATNAYYSNFNAFLKDNLGSGIKEKDIRRALELTAVYTKYAEVMQVEFEKATTLADLIKFRDENPDDYYKIDYLTYVAQDKAWADKIATAKTEEEFKKLALDAHFEANYLNTFNKAVANAVIDEIKNLKDENGGTALTTKLDQLGFGQATNYNADSDLLKNNSDIKTWMLNTSRVAGDESSFVVDGKGVYVISIQSAYNSTDKNITARVKLVSDETGSSYDGDEKFKENVKTYLTEYKKDKDRKYPEVTHNTAAKNAEALKAAVIEAIKDKTGDDLTAVWASFSAVKPGAITSSSSTSTTLPQTVLSKVNSSDNLNSSTKEYKVKVGDYLIATEDDASAYLIYVEKVGTDKKSVEIRHIQVDGDLYYTILDELKASLDKVYPTDKTANYSSKPEDEEEAKKWTGSFEEWISATKGETGYESARAELDAKSFETNEVDSDGEETGNKIYTAYMVMKNEDHEELLYLDTEEVIKGGYLKYTADASTVENAKDAATKAKDALETIKNLTDLDLLNALAALDTSNATVDTAIKADTLKGLDSGKNEDKIYDWFFSSDRKANDIAVVTAKSSSTATADDIAFLLVYSEKAEAWAATAKTNYVTEQLTDWSEGLAEKYSVNQKNLNKLGKPTPTTEAETK